jgi:hypothetical protein
MGVGRVVERLGLEVLRRARKERLAKVDEVQDRERPVR